MISTRSTTGGTGAGGKGRITVMAPGSAAASSTLKSLLAKLGIPNLGGPYKPNPGMGGVEGEILTEQEKLLKRQEEELKETQTREAYTRSNSLVDLMQSMLLSQRRL